MGHEVLVVTGQIWIAPYYDKAKESENSLDQLLSLINFLVLADEVIVIWPGLVVGFLICLGV